MSLFLKKEAQCVCRNKLVIVIDCGSSIYNVAINDVFTNVNIKEC